MNSPEPKAEDLLFPPPNEAELSALKAAHRKVFTFAAAGHTVACKPMGRVTWKRIQQMQSDPDDKTDITETILADTLLFPTRERFDQLLDEYPAAAEAIALDLVGLAKGDEAKRGKRA